MTSSQQVHVQMKHGLSRARAHVKHRAVSLLDVALASNLRRHQVAAAYGFGVRSLGFFQSGKMFLGDNQHMRGRLRIDVFKSKYVLVFVHFLRRNLAAENAAEQAIRCGIGHRSVTMGNNNT